MRDRDGNTETTITFTKKPPTYSGRQRQCDIIKEPLGLRGIAKNCKTELECLKLFITEEMIDVIVENTNIVIADIVQTQKKFVKSLKYPFLKLTTQEDISALLELIYYWGLCNLANITTNICFCDAKGFLVFGAVMKRDR